MPDGSTSSSPTSSTPLPASDGALKPQPPPPKTRPRRAPLVDRIVPPLILMYMPTAYYQVTRRVLVAYIKDHLHRPVLSYVLLASTTLSITVLLRAYLSAYLLPATHSAPPFDPPEAVVARTVVYECADDDGNVARCDKEGDGGCKGGWKGARVRHCSVCGMCRSGFDHHCPWFATCISASTHVAFLTFLAFTPLTVVPATLPILAPLYHHVWRIYTFSRLPGGVMETMWYRRWWSWLLGVGPIGRIGVGVVGGFWTWPTTEKMGGGGREEWESGVLVLVVAIGWGVSVIATGLLLSSLHSILTSSTPIESRIRSAHARRDPRANSPSSRRTDPHPRADPRVRFWIPNPDPDPARKGDGVVVKTRPDERPYDLGWRGNWQAFWRGREGGSDGLPKMNPLVLKRLEYEAGLCFDEDASGSDVEGEEGGDDVSDLSM